MEDKDEIIAKQLKMSAEKGMLELFVNLMNRFGNEVGTELVSFAIFTEVVAAKLALDTRCNPDRKKHELLSKQFEDMVSIMNGLFNGLSIDAHFMHEDVFQAMKEKKEKKENANH